MVVPVDSVLMAALSIRETTRLNSIFAGTDVRGRWTREVNLLRSARMSPSLILGRGSQPDRDSRIDLRVFR